MGKVLEFDLRTASYRRTVDGVATWAQEHHEVLIGVRGLLALGDQAAEAIAAIASIREVRQLVLGWALMSALIEGEGLDPERLLYRSMPYELVDLVLGAFEALEDAA